MNCETFEIIQVSQLVPSGDLAAKLGKAGGVLRPLDMDLRAGLAQITRYARILNPILSLP